MKVALFTNAYKPIVSGVVVNINFIKDALKERGHEVYVFAPEFYDYEDEEEGVWRFKSMDLTSKVDFPVAFPYSKKAYETLKEFNPDIIHVHHPFVLGQTAYRYAKRLNVPIVLTFHTSYVYTEYFPFPESWVKMTNERIVKGFGNKVSCIITPSEAKTKVLRDYGVTNRIEVIPNSLDLRKYTDVSGEQTEALRKELGLEDKKVMLYVGRVATEKNLDFLLEAFATVNKDDEDTALLVVGDGPELSRIKEKADEMGMTDEVKFTGNVDYNKLPVFYKMADVFTFASPDENLPMVVIEAMAAALPIVALDVDWARNVITGGYDGILTEESAESYAAAISQVLNNTEKREEIQRNQLITAEKYSVENMAERMLGLYEEVIEQEKNQP